MNSKSILVVGPAWVGDMVMAQVLFRTLQAKAAARHESVHIDVLAPAWSHPLLDRMPEVRRAILAPFAHGELNVRARWALGRQLANEHYDQAILLPQSFKSALIPFFAGIPKRTGWRGEWRYGLLNDLRVLDKKQMPLLVQRFAALADEAGAKLPDPILYPKLRIESASIQTALDAFHLKIDKPILVLCPGAEYGPAKRWPAEYFAELAQLYLQRDWQVWLFGSHKEQALTQIIQQYTKHACTDLAGKTTLAQAIDLMSLAQLVLSNDSGLMHIACALGRKTAVVYGSSDPNYTPPLFDDVKILSLGLSCSPCFERECPLTHLRCLRDLSVTQVDMALQALLSEA
jgi:heptosyltransferase-2